MNKWNWKNRAWVYVQDCRWRSAEKCPDRPRSRSHRSDRDIPNWNYYVICLFITLVDCWAKKTRPSPQPVVDGCLMCRIHFLLAHSWAQMCSFKDCVKKRPNDFEAFQLLFFCVLKICLFSCHKRGTKHEINKTNPISVDNTYQPNCYFDWLFMLD